MPVTAVSGTKWAFSMVSRPHLVPKPFCPRYANRYVSLGVAVGAAGGCRAVKGGLIGNKMSSGTSSVCPPLLPPGSFLPPGRLQGDPDGADSRQDVGLLQ